MTLIVVFQFELHLWTASFYSGFSGDSIFSIHHSFIGFSLIAQLVKNLPAMQETLVQFLGQEDPLEKG